MFRESRTEDQRIDYGFGPSQTPAYAPWDTTRIAHLDIATDRRRSLRKMKYSQRCAESSAECSCLLTTVHFDFEKVASYRAI
jgi:hypothetical protein